MYNNNLDSSPRYETRIILPIYDSDGERAPATVLHVQEYLCKEFGGYTMTNGVGAWATPTTTLPTTEPVLIFDVAAPATTLTRVAMVELAYQIIERMDQEAVYLRHCNGQVELVGVTNTQHAHECLKCGADLDGAWVPEEAYCERCDETVAIAPESS